MSIALLEQPWCFIIIALILVLLFAAAAIQARQQRLERYRVPGVHGFPSAQFPVRAVAASAPLEALAALETRLAELHRHLPPQSPDARWLALFLQQLRAAMDDLYDHVAALPPHQQATALHRIAGEVAALDGVVNLHLGATLTEATDHEALEAQLAALRRSV